MATGTDPARWLTETDDRLIQTVLTILTDRGRNRPRPNLKRGESVSKTAILSVRIISDAKDAQKGFQAASRAADGFRKGLGQGVPHRWCCRCGATGPRQGRRRCRLRYATVRGCGVHRVQTASIRYSEVGGVGVEDGGPVPEPSPTIRGDPGCATEKPGYTHLPAGTQNERLDQIRCRPLGHLRWHRRGCCRGAQRPAGRERDRPYREVRASRSNSPISTPVSPRMVRPG